MSQEQPNRGERPTRRRDDDGERAGREDREGQAERRPARQEGEERRPRPAQRQEGEERRPRPAQQQEGEERRSRPAQQQRQEGEERPSRPAQQQDGEERRPRPAQRQEGEERRPRPAQQHDGERPQHAQHQEGRDHDRPREADRDHDQRPFDALAASRLALEALQTLTSRTAEGVIGVEREDDGGWIVVVELLETARIPATADVLGEYEVQIAPDRSLRSYTRRARYTRASTMTDS